MDKDGERTLNLKIVKALAKMKGQMSASCNNENSKSVYVKRLYEMHNCNICRPIIGGGLYFSSIVDVQNLGNEFHY